MVKTEHDLIVAALAADIASPQVGPAIDRALEAIEVQRQELVELRKWAVRRHGEWAFAIDSLAPTPVPAPLAQVQLKAPLNNQSTSDPSYTVSKLVDAYLTDKDSPLTKIRFRTRVNYVGLCKRVAKDHGAERLQDIKARDFLRWHEEWSTGGKLAMSHALIRIVRQLVNYGAVILENEECQRLVGILSKMRFKMAKARTERLTREYANAIRATARRIGRDSVALAQALQFDCQLNQIDVIGQWIPESEPGETSIRSNRYGKWVRGLRWEQIDKKLIFRHRTSNGEKKVEIDLHNMPMVLEELERRRPFEASTGPMIVDEDSGQPYLTEKFRRTWREIADAAGVPPTVRNSDTRVSTASKEAIAAEIE